MDPSRSVGSSAIRGLTMVESSSRNKTQRWATDWSDEQDPRIVHLPFTWAHIVGTQEVASIMVVKTREFD